MISFLARLFTHSPLHPYWLHDLKYEQANRHVLRLANFGGGDVLEVGAGDGTRKAQLLERYPSVRYVATDFSTWDDEFEVIDRLVAKYGRAGESILGYKKRAKLDKVMSALDIPYKDASFDYHLSFETLEHLDLPDRYYQEAARVLRQNGYAVVSVPYLYRLHGGEPNHKKDYYRYSNGFFYSVAERFGFAVEEIYSNTGLGTTVAVAVNQWVILSIRERNLAARFIFTILAIPTFFLSNTVGWLIDLWPDRRFATHWHVVMKKL